MSLFELSQWPSMALWPKSSDMPPAAVAENKPATVHALFTLWHMRRAKPEAPMEPSALFGHILYGWDGGKKREEGGVTQHHVGPAPVSRRRGSLTVRLPDLVQR